MASLAQALKKILSGFYLKGLENRSAVCDAIPVAQRHHRLLFHSFAFSSLLAFAASAGPTLKQDSAWRQYRNQHWGYCVSYPSRWLKGDAFEGAGIFVETGVKKHSRPVAEIDVAALPNRLDDPGAFTLVQDLQSHFDGLKKFERAEQLEILEKRETKLLGNAALFTKDRYYDPQDRAKWIEEIVFADRKEALYRLELECRADQLGRFEPVFAHFVSSFQFDCGAQR